VKTILLVDDSPTMLLSMSAVLTRGGYSALQAPSGDAALARLRTHQVDAVITDLNMPGMDGIALVRELRRLPAYRTVPLLLLTTESSPERRTAARAAGATGWLVKPVGGEELLLVLKKVLPG
jgi:two-component system chemotaxis response regulator CheY